MISFDNVNAFYVLILLLFVYFISSIVKNYENYFSKEMLLKIIVGKNKKHINMTFLVFSFVFLIIALARPIIKNNPIKVSQSNVNIVVAFDISASMKCEDVYPNRLKFSKNKFDNVLSHLKDEKVGVIGFSSRSFLISPITNDYGTLKYLVDNLNQEMVNVQGSEILGALETTNNLLNNQQQKALIVFTDGTDTQNFDESIEYAKDNNIKVFVYTVATQKGGTIPISDDDVQKDSNGNIVITNLNSQIKKLAFESGGAYLEFSSASTDISKFIDVIRSKFKSKEQDEVIINTNNELFYIPLIIAFILFLIAISSFRKGRR